MRNLIKNKGITLIALIVVIVIMLILTGITIAKLNNSGLFEKSKLAKEKYEIAKEDEKNRLNEYSDLIDNSRETITVDKEEYDKLKKDLDTLMNNNSKVLWEGNLTSINIEQTLNDNIENYKYLILQTRWSDSNAKLDYRIDVDEIKKTGYFKTNYSGTNSHTLITMFDSYYIYVSFTTNSSFVIPARNSYNGNIVYLEKIIGYKY